MSDSEVSSTFSIISYSDAECISEIDRMDLSNKPQKLSINGQINYSISSPMGIPVRDFNYSYSVPRSLSFELLFDGTGVVDGIKESVTEKCIKLQEIAHKYNEEINSPNYLRIIWGEFDFKGRLTNLSFDYVMFYKSGKTARAIAYLSLLETLVS